MGSVGTFWKLYLFRTPALLIAMGWVLLADIARQPAWVLALVPVWVLGVGCFLSVVLAAYRALDAVVDDRGV